MAQAIPYVIMAAAAAAQTYNTQKTAKRQDRQLAESIRRQGKKQAEADAKVNEQVATLEKSRSDDERRQRQDQYMQILQRGKQTQQAGLTPMVGSSAFQADAANARAANDAFATGTAGLESRIDAPTMQRQGEGFGYGQLATDIGRISREARGDAYIDELRYRAIHRNPWIDAAAKVAGNYSAGMAGMGGASSSGSPFTAQGGANAAGYGAFSGANYTTPGYWNRSWMGGLGG